MLNPLTIFKIARFKVESYLFNKLIKSGNAWRLFDKAGIEGFGVNLIRLYFPIYYDKKSGRDSFSEELKQNMSNLFDHDKHQNSYSESVAAAMPGILMLPVKETDQVTPYLDNYYFGVFDAAVLAATMQIFKPSKIVEIGSGISTKYMKLFKDKFSLSTQIICIDPYPRSEIDSVADKIIKQPLENVINDGLFQLQNGDILFLDGSHYTYQGNDTLMFFFNILPAIPSGVIIHIHDIYLPFDYPENVAKQLWTEQYLLAAMLLGGFKGYEAIYPAYYMSQTNEFIKKHLAGVAAELQTKNFSLRADHTAGYSFWFKKSLPSA